MSKEEKVRLAEDKTERDLLVEVLGSLKNNSECFSSVCSSNYKQFLDRYTPDVWKWWADYQANEAKRKEELKRSALDKLTAAERAVLGV